MSTLTITLRNPQDGSISEHVIGYTDAAQAKADHAAIAAAMKDPAATSAVVVNGTTDSLVVGSLAIVSAKLSA